MVGFSKLLTAWKIVIQRVVVLAGLGALYRFLRQRASYIHMGNGYSGKCIMIFLHCSIVCSSLQLCSLAEIWEQNKPRFRTTSLVVFNCKFSVFRAPPCVACKCFCTCGHRDIFNNHAGLNSWTKGNSFLQHPHTYWSQHNGKFANFDFNQTWGSHRGTVTAYWVASWSLGLVYDAIILNPLISEIHDQSICCFHCCENCIKRLLTLRPLKDVLSECFSVEDSHAIN